MTKDVTVDVKMPDLCTLRDVLGLTLPPCCCCSQVPSALVRVGPSTATLRRALAKDDFSVEGEMRLKCVVTLADKYREPSHVVTVRRRDELEEPPVVVAESDLVNAVDEPMPGPADRSAAAGAGKSSATPATPTEAPRAAAAGVHYGILCSSVGAKPALARFLEDRQPASHWSRRVKKSTHVTERGAQSIALMSFLCLQARWRCASAPAC